MNDAVLSINATIGKRGADDCKGDLEAKVKAAMRAVIDENWMATRDEELFRAGVGGALLSVGLDSDDGRLLERSVQALRRFDAMLNAAQAGLTVDIGEVAKDHEGTVPLMKWWHEIRRGSGSQVPR